LNGNRTHDLCDTVAGIGAGTGIGAGIAEVMGSIPVQA